MDRRPGGRAEQEDRQGLRRPPEGEEVTGSHPGAEEADPLPQSCLVCLFVQIVMGFKEGVLDSEGFFTLS